MKKIFLIFCFIIFSLVFALAVYAQNDYIDTSLERISELESRQEHAHNIAESARHLGYEEDSYIINTVRDEWWEAYYDIQEIKYWREIQNEKDAKIIATVIYHEGMFGTTERHKELIAAVVMNRVNSDKFPNTVYDVVTQPGQYLAAYANESGHYMQTAMSDTENWNLCLEIAYRALNGEIECPTNVLYQSNFNSLGCGYYEVCYTSYSVTYFAYG